jgi:hypothetical protein
MRKTVFLIAILAAVLISLSAFAVEAGTTGKDVQFTTVSELLSAKDSPTGQVRFEGKVVKVFPAEKMLGIADPAKCATDCATPCTPELLPVKWEGAMPDQNSLVRVSGAVSKVDGKQVFVATSVNKAVKTSCCDQ